MKINDHYLAMIIKLIKLIILIIIIFEVRAKTPNSHADKGWQPFTDHIIKTLSNESEGHSHLFIILIIIYFLLL